jgi:hypothetical protein
MAPAWMARALRRLTGATFGIMTDQSEYVLALRQGFEGEFGGAEIARLLGAGPWGENARHTLILLQCIEEQTRDQIAGLLREAGVEPATPDRTEGLGAMAAQLQGKTWAEVSNWFVDGTKGARPTYERIRDSGPSAEDPRVQAIVHHVDIVEGLFQNEVAGTSNPGPAIAYLSETNKQRLRDAGASWSELG